MVEELAQDIDMAASLLAVAMGEGARTEDDCFVPLIEILCSGRWSAASPDRSLAAFRRIAASGGYPLKPVAEVCSSIVEIECHSDEPESDNTVYVRAESEFAGRAFRITTPSRSRDPHWGIPCRQVVKLTCDDAAFLCMILNNEPTKLVLRCSSYGSWKNPRLTRSSVAEVVVPWPDAPERKRLLAECARHERLAWELGVITDDLQDALKSIGDDEDPGGLPWELDENYEDVVKYYQKLGDCLRDRVAINFISSKMPAPIAILQRQINSTLDFRERQSRLRDQLEVVLKLDLAIQCAVIEARNSGVVHLVFPLNGRRQNGDYQLTLGQWLLANLSARERLRQPAGAEGEAHELRVFAEKLVGVNSGRIDEIAGALVRMRNEETHGTAKTSEACREACEQFSEKTRDLLVGLEYLRSHSMVYVERVSRKLHETTLVVRELTGDNPEFARNTIRRPPDTPLDSIREGEVYLEYFEPDLLLSLYPWVHFGRASASSQEAVWLFDGIKKGKVIYKSAQVPAPATWEIKEPRLVSDVERLLGLRR